MKNANVRVLLAAAVLIVLAAAAGLTVGRQNLTPGIQRTAPEALQMAGVTVTPAFPEANGQTKAVLRIQVGGETLPDLPLTEDGVYMVSQPEKEAVNVIHTTATGAVMHSSTCDNQNCVEQGEVTLDNRDWRVMGNLIVCLPNQVLLELLSAEEAHIQGGSRE